MGFEDYKYTLKKYFKFSKDEILGIVISALLFGFIVSFREWGPGDSFELIYGLKNFMNSTLIALLAVLVHESAHKAVALYKGYNVKVKVWWHGIIIALALCFITRGHVWFLALSGITIAQLPRLKIGVFRYNMRQKDMSLIALAGPVANIILATLIKTPSVWFPNLPLNMALIQKAFVINWAIAIANFLPIPPLDGIHTFFQSRLLYISILGFMIGYGILIYFGIYSWILALLFAGIIFYAFYHFFER